MNDTILQIKVYSDIYLQNKKRFSDQKQTFAVFTIALKERDRFVGWKDQKRIAHFCWQSESQDH